MSTTTANSPKATSTHSAGSGSKTMAELMAKSTGKQFVTPKKGDVLSGVITKLDYQQIVVDIQAKSDAMVLEKDPQIMKTLLMHLKLGQTVQVSVLNPESDTGNPVVSLRRFVDDILWKRLEEVQKSSQKLNGVIREATKGGFVVEASLGFSGFLPNSQTTFSFEQGESNLQELVGKRLEVYVLEQTRATRKIIFSQKPILDTKAFATAVTDIKVGQTVRGIVTNTASFGVFVTLVKQPSIEALIHISEISWKQVNNLSELFATGQEVEAKVIGIDPQAKRLELSIKRLTEDPFELSVKDLAVDGKVSGLVIKTDENGIAVQISEGVEGLIRKEKIPVGASYEVGKKVDATISQIDLKRRKVYLIPVTLRKTIGYR